MRYFAYGANMHSQYLRRRLPDVTVLGAAKIMGYELHFHKYSYQDGSGKCNILQSRDPQQAVYGVLYEISPRSRYLLDKAEHLGYGTQDVTLKVYPVCTQEHTSADSEYAFTYIAHKESIREDVSPFNWYHALVLAGAKEHNLPQSYINLIESHKSIEDPNYQRSRSIAIPMATGIAQ